jgi:peptidoglycan/LPS O-acetylase OafA/YrhL
MDKFEFKYRPDIDGLRTIAVISVIIFHAFPSVLPAGFIGVDVFFVISGFLITSIIYREVQLDKFSIITFYKKRMRRIFPALIIVLVVSFIIGFFVLSFSDFRLLGKHIFSGMTFMSNIILYREAGYFDIASENKPLLHLWSLGVEEQFYFIWPLFLFIFARK